jgi:hypothetical protein
MIFELLPPEIQSAYVKHRVAAISVTGPLTIRVRLMWRQSWDVWKYVNGRWVRQANP